METRQGLRSLARCDVTLAPKSTQGLRPRRPDTFTTASVDTSALPHLVGPAAVACRVVGARPRPAVPCGHVACRPGSLLALPGARLARCRCMRPCTGDRCRRERGTAVR